jgi:ABC-type sugar transport system substrate-binding protein
VLILDTVQFPEIVQRNDAIIKELARACPSCTVTRQAFSPPEAPQRLAGLVSAQLQQNPKINYVSGPYDAAATFIAQGIRQAQKTSNVKFVSAEGSPSGYQLIKDGDMAADLAISNQFPGWLAVDTLARKLANSQYPEEQLLPQRLFTNKEELPTSQLGWDMDFDYRAAFKKLWSK